MLALIFLMLSTAYYAQNYAGIIGLGLISTPELNIVKSLVPLIYVSFLLNGEN